MTDKTPELAPCPFCHRELFQHEGILQGVAQWHHVDNGCFLEGLSIGPDETDEIAAWNTRVDGWQDISTAPKDEKSPFVVLVNNDLGEPVELQVRVFQGDIYPCYLGVNIDHDDRVTGIEKWRPSTLPSPPGGE